MIHKMIFRLAYRMKRPRVLRYYDEFQKTQWLPFEELQERQIEQLRKLITYVYKNIPYYTRVFNELGLKPSGISSIQDLEKLPILTKQTIKQNWQDFLPRTSKGLQYINSSTGGSTGEPLKYRMSVEDYERGVALLYRGWGYAGYKLGDKVAIIAGSSLIPTTRSEFYKKLQGLCLNSRHYSAFDMSEGNLFRYFNDINRWEPTFIRGYASSIYLFAKFIRDNNLKLNFQPTAIFTTSEKLFYNQRELIEHVFNARIFDNYGLNDGGVSTYECEAHCGMHIDMERSILEVVDEDGKQIINQHGRILATSLYNYGLPFIRYDTGDLGYITDGVCGCGRGYKLMEEIVGRAYEFLIDPLGRYIHGAAFYNDIMGEINNVNAIKGIQVIQKSRDKIMLDIVSTDTFDDSEVYRIREIVRKKFNGLDVEFKFVDKIERTVAGKYKFIINTIERNKT